MLAPEIELRVATAIESAFTRNTAAKDPVTGWVVQSQDNCRPPRAA